MSEVLVDKLRAFFAREDTESEPQPRDMAVLLRLGSGSCFGLILVDEEAQWARDDGAERVVFSPATAKRFVEWLEHDRRALEDSIEAKAVELGLPGLETVFSLPVFAFARELLAGPSPYFVYQTMRWLRPTDLRELRKELKAVADNPAWPEEVRDLAEHLVVPEG